MRRNAWGWGTLPAVVELVTARKKYGGRPSRPKSFFQSFWAARVDLGDMPISLEITTGSARN